MPAKIEQIIEDFWSPSGRDLAYQSLIETVRYATGTSQKEAISFLLNIFSCLEDKNEAWDALKEILNSKDSDLIKDVLRLLGPAFKDLPDKSESWQELHRLTLSKDIWIKEYAAFAIGPAFAHIPEEFKEQAMKDLFRLARNSHEGIQESVAMSLKFAFPYLPDRNKAWNILVNMALEDDCDVGLEAAVTFKSAFPYVPDKIDAWESLLYIINSESYFSAYRTTFSLFSSYPFYPDKVDGYHDLIELLTHEDSDIRDAATISIGYIFQHFPDKVLAQKDLMSLLNDSKFDLKGRLIISMGNAFSALPDKEGAWHLLHQHVKNDDASIRKGVAFSIGDACPDLPFPEISLRDLLILAQDENDSVRMGAAHSLGFIYPHVDEDYKILDCLAILAKDDDGYVRNRANYSLGKIFIYKASKTKDERALGYLIEKAVVNFEKAAIEDCYFNPAEFCSLFYRSFSEVLFRKQISREEIEKYIVNAKSIAKDSTNKRRLIKVVENLSDALYSAQDPHKIGIESKAELITYCRKQCDYAEYLMDKTKETAPNLNELFHNLKPSFDRNIKELIDDVKGKAEAACRVAKGTPDAEVTCSLYKEATKLDETVSYDVNFETVTSIAFLLKGKINKNPEYHYLLPEIDKIYSELSLNRKLGIVRDILGVVEFGSSSGEIIGKLDSLDKKTGSIYETVQTTVVSIEQLLSLINQMQISQSGIKEEIQVTVGLSGFGSGAQHVITIPLQDISYLELKDDLLRCSGKMLDIAKFPSRLKDGVMGYIRKNGYKLRGE